MSSLSDWSNLFVMSGCHTVRVSQSYQNMGLGQTVRRLARLLQLEMKMVLGHRQKMVWIKVGILDNTKEKKNLGLGQTMRK